MRTWKIVISTLIIVALTVGLACAGIIYSGTYNVAASAKHWPITYWVLKQTVQQSVTQHAASIKPPEPGGKKELLVGAVHFDENCSGCHTPPGGHKSEAARGMYPSPPDLAQSAREMPANRIFWIIKHGIKASGMPAWGVTHGDDAMWAMTALIKRFSDMTHADYQRLLQTAGSRGIGHHHGEHSHEHGEAQDHHKHQQNEGHHGEPGAPHHPEPHRHS